MLNGEETAYRGIEAVIGVAAVTLACFARQDGTSAFLYGEIVAHALRATRKFSSGHSLI